MDLIRAHSGASEKLAAGLTEFEIYIRNNREFIPNFGERYRGTSHKLEKCIAKVLYAG